MAIPAYNLCKTKKKRANFDKIIAILRERIATVKAANAAIEAMHIPSNNTASRNGTDEGAFVATLAKFCNQENGTCTCSPTALVGAFVAHGISYDSHRLQMVLAFFDDPCSTGLLIREVVRRGFILYLTRTSVSSDRHQLSVGKLVRFRQSSDEAKKKTSKGS